MQRRSSRSSVSINIHGQEEKLDKAVKNLDQHSKSLLGQLMNFVGLFAGRNVKSLDDITHDVREVKTELYRLYEEIEKLMSENSSLNVDNLHLSQRIEGHDQKAKQMAELMFKTNAVRKNRGFFFTKKKDTNPYFSRDQVVDMLKHVLSMGETRTIKTVTNVHHDYRTRSINTNNGLELSVGTSALGVVAANPGVISPALSGAADIIKATKV